MDNIMSEEPTVSVNDMKEFANTLSKSHKNKIIRVYETVESGELYITMTNQYPPTPPVETLHDVKVKHLVSYCNGVPSMS